MHLYKKVFVGTYATVLKKYIVIHIFQQILQVLKMYTIFFSIFNFIMDMMQEEYL